MGEDKVLGFSIAIDGVSQEATELAKIQLQLVAIKKERNELIKQASASGHLGSIEERQKLAAYNKEIDIQEAALKTLKRVVDTANDSLARKKALLIELTAKSDKATQAIRDGMAPAILKLSNEIKAGENARGVFTRNVGNYPEITKAAAGGFSELTSAVGGTTGEIGNAVESFATAGGAAGMFTAVIAGLAAIWKNAGENIKSYLESADKLKYGGSGFNKDAEASMKDAEKRARGGVTEGTRLENEAKDLLLLRKNLTDEEKKELQLQIESGQRMQKDNNDLLSSMGKNLNVMTTMSDRLHEQLTWRLTYRNLLKEEEQIVDDKLVKETEWMKLEADLVKQRAIVSNIATTEAAKKQAVIDADKIVNQLVKEKAELIDRELVNVTALSKMTATEEVNEEKINGLQKEKNTVQREYYADQIKINRLERTAAKDTAKELKDKKDALNEITDKQYDALTIYIGAEKKQADQRMKLATMGMGSTSFGIDKVTAGKISKTTQDSVNDIGNIIDDANAGLIARQARHDRMILDMAQRTEDSKMNIANNAVNLLSALGGKTKSIQKAALIAEKIVAISQIVMQARVANMATTAWGAAYSIPTFGGSLLIAAAINAKNKIAEIFNIGSVIASAAIGFVRGGKINRGIPIDTGTVDNRLIAVNNTETVLTQRHVAALGGSGVMRRIGVPGYAEGGYVGQQAPVMASQGYDFQSMVNAIKGIQIRLDTNKVYDSLNELAVINETQRI